MQSPQLLEKFPVSSNGCMERLKRNFYSLGYHCTPNLSIHQNSTQELTWNFLVTLDFWLVVLEPEFWKAAFENPLLLLRINWEMRSKLQVSLLRLVQNERVKNQKNKINKLIENYIIEILYLYTFLSSIVFSRYGVGSLRFVEQVWKTKAEIHVAF